MKPPTNPTNQQVVGGFNRHEKWAFEWIYNDSKAIIYELAKDILKSKSEAKDVMTDMYVKLRDMKTRKGTIKKIRDLVYVSTRNLALQNLIKKQRDQTVMTAIAGEPAEITEFDMELYETHAALYYEIYRCKNKLTPQAQRVFNLHFFDNKSIPEIAKELNISTKTVSNNKARALKVMKLELGPRRSFIFFLNILS